MTELYRPNAGEHPITPPPELVGQWTALANEEEGCKVWNAIATQAAQWGADMELEACMEWVQWWDDITAACQLRAARRPKPPSLKEQALEALEHILHNSSTELGAETIRRAIEQLPDAL